jgi:hypothetical protein
MQRPTQAVHLPVVLTEGIMSTGQAHGEKAALGCCASQNVRLFVAYRAQGESRGRLLRPYWVL